MQQQQSRARTRRGWTFRLLGIVVGISPFVMAEAVCIVFDWGRETDYEDPFVGFSGTRPLFVLDDSKQNYEIPKSRRGFFAAESFPARKRKKVFRVFCFGGSTVQGRPYSKETSFTTWLEIGLKAADSTRDWDVVNCGGVSYASYRLTPIVQECLQYQPDLFIICSGHNEFLEERTYENVKHASAAWKATQRMLSGLRTYTLCRHGLRKAFGKSMPSADQKRPLLKEEVDALLDYKGGIKAYHRDEEWRAGVIAHYENNIRRMIGIARDADVPVILIRPTSNLGDCPPFKSQHRDDLTADELAAWKSAVADAKANYRTDLQTSIKQLNRAIEIDGQYAVTFYELGKCYDALGRKDQARKAFWRARETDICPLRILEPMERALAGIASETGTPLIDAHGLLEQNCPGGILGDYLLVDHIHPSFSGHQLIANALAAEMIRQGWVRKSAKWETRRDAIYMQHLESLDDLYFLHGQRTLESLQAWTQGRADGPPIESRIKLQSP